MKNKLLLPMFIFLFSILEIYAQNNHYYYYKGQKVYLTLDKNNITLSILDDFQKSSVSTLKLKNFNVEKDNTNKQNNKYARIEFQNTPTDADYLKKINALNENPNIIKAQPNFFNPKGVKIGMSDYFYIKLKNSNDLTLLQNLALQKNVQIVEQNQFMPLWYTLKCKKKTIGSTLEIANYFFETGNFASAVPDFLSDDLVCSNDPQFGSLWGLNNTANPSVDINACQAWGITQGNGVTVAVLDQGIQLTHQDLSANIFPLSYNTETNTSPSQVFGEHGTHCAGTIAAIKDNNIQVVGVSPLSKLMSVSNSLTSTPNSRMKRADGINWAWQNGADIISNSWSSAVQFQIIDEAIENAITNGRNGKGTIIVFASGNDYGAISYPANINPKIITVGALTSSGSRSGFSNYGSQLDVVAPGSNILSTLLNNTTGALDGTSMATPHVAGVCALILSVNPSLTSQQVSDIIEKTSQKVGNYSYGNVSGRINGTWNDQMGYGLIDAYGAVLMAQSLAQISGNSSICSSQTYTAPSGSNSWSWSITEGANLATLSATNTNSVTLTPIGGSGYVTISLYYGSSAYGYITTTKRIFVNESNINILTAEYDNFCTNIDVYMGIIALGANASSYLNFYNFNSTVPSQDNLIRYEPNGYTPDGTPRYFVVAPKTLLGENIWFTMSYYNQCGQQIIKSAEFPLTPYDCDNYSAKTASGTNTFTIYPNPSSSTINVALLDQNNTPLKSIITGKLYDFNNNEKRSLSIKKNNAQIDVTGLEKGIYILKIDIDGKTENHRVIVK
jgi:hypothetical protein